jgi:uncharacterized protein YjbJ (UPF0337 family)
MTSWERGRENEREGQIEEQQGRMRGDIGEEMRGAAKDLGGKVEQGLDNIGDTLTGKQRDLEGNDRNVGKEAQTWAEHRGDDINRTARNVGNDLENAADNAGEWIRERGEDIRNA